MADATTMDERQEREARIERMLAETRTFVVEGLKLQAEARKLDRDASLAPWQATFVGFGAGAALMGVTIAVLKLFP